MLITTAITNITIICILVTISIVLFSDTSIRVYADPAIASNAAPFIRISVPLTLDKIQFIPNQLMFHLDNHTSGAIESISNETGKNIIQYFKYNPEQNTVTVSNSIIYAHYDLQIPYQNNPNSTIIQKVNRAFDILYIANPDPRFPVPSTTYFGEINKKFLSINGITYDKLNTQVIIPNDLNKHQALMIVYPSINK
jgi:hypothetical protein